MLNMTMNGSNHLVLDRRKFLGGAAGLIAAGIMPKSALALAAPYAFKQGAYDVTVVSDGTLTAADLRVSRCQARRPKDLARRHDARRQGAVRGQPAALQVGKRCDPHGYGLRRGLPAHLRKTCRKPEGRGHRGRRHHQSDFHPRPPRSSLGKPRRRWQAHFRQRLVPRGRNQWNFWTAPDLAGKMPKDMEGMVKNTQGQLAAIKDKVAMFKPGAEVLPEINVIDTAGHTPGHARLSSPAATASSSRLMPSPIRWSSSRTPTGNSRLMPTTTRRLPTAKNSSAWPRRKEKTPRLPLAFPGIGMAEAKDGAYIYVPAA